MNSPMQQAPQSFGSWVRQRTVQFAAAGVVIGLVFPAIASIMKLSELGLPVTLVNMLAMQGMDRVLWITDTAPLFLGLLAGIAGRREDLHLQASKMVQQREAELDAIRKNLEDTVAERARQLDQRNAQMRSVVTFARQIADIQDLPTLLSTAVRMIGERFERADADLYLLDENHQWAILRASSSVAGSELMKNAHRVAVGEQTAVGRVARRGTLNVAPIPSDNAAEATATPAAQTTLPLAVRGRIIGVLDVRSRGAQAGSQSETEILQLLADQLAATIENARLVGESRAAVQQFETASAQSTRGAWQQFLKKNAVAYQLTPSGVRPATSFSGNGSSGALRMSITLRGQEIGALHVKRSSGKPWTETERDLMEKLATQVALAVENARLIEETRQRAAQEQIISEVSARFSRSLDVEALLQAAVREFAALPEVAEATVVLKPTSEQGPQAGN